MVLSIIICSGIIAFFWINFFKKSPQYNENGNLSLADRVYPIRNTLPKPKEIIIRFKGSFSNSIPDKRVKKSNRLRFSHKAKLKRRCKK